MLGGSAARSFMQGSKTPIPNLPKRRCLSRSPAASPIPASAKETRSAAVWHTPTPLTIGCTRSPPRRVDRRSRSRARGVSSYKLVQLEVGNGTKVLIDIDYVLQGPLTQFLHSELLQEIGRVLVVQFVENPNRRLAPHATARAPTETSAPQPRKNFQSPPDFVARFSQTLAVSERRNPAPFERLV